MADVSFRVTVRRPVEEVFTVLTDPEQTPRWSRSTVEEEWLTPPPHGVGSRRRAVGQAFGRRSANVAEVVAFEPNRSWTLHSVGGPSFETSAVFTPGDGGTRVDWTWSFAFRGLLRPVGPLVAAVFRRQFARDLQNLKAMMERGEL
jgi:uncharacterized protein YndB with AHSA1/START domain